MKGIKFISVMRKSSEPLCSELFQVNMNKKCGILIKLIETEMFKIETD